jgi:hypothetical protein
MRPRGILRVAAAGTLASALASPAAAQFDPQHNHLKCYKIGGPAFLTRVQLDNQFGREIVAKLVPQFLCVPTQKTCCDPQKPGCVPLATGCPPDPSPNQPAPVDHFKCYKIAAKQCDLNDPTLVDPCTRLSGKFVKTPVDLLDQFHPELNVTVGVPKMLCVPVVKTPKNTTTTHPPPTTTSTTIEGCRPDAGQPPTCAGPCPNLGEVCVNRTPGTVDCGCVPDTQVCAAQQATACASGRCTRVDQQCVFDGTACACTPP